MDKKGQQVQVVTAVHQDHLAKEVHRDPQVCQGREVLKGFWVMLGEQGQLVPKEKEECMEVQDHLVNQVLPEIKVKWDLLEHLELRVNKD